MSALRNGKNRLKRKEHPNQEDEKEYYKERKDQEKWKKRKQTCYRKLMELSLFCDADVYALIHRHGEVYTLKSTVQITDQESFPPPETALGGLKGKPEVADFQQRVIPEPLLSNLAATSREFYKVGGTEQSSGKNVIQPPVWNPSPLRENFPEKCSRTL